ncbi:MAG: NAD(P)H-binding protein [Bacteroidales bacterium]|nr:NAD(P)H-binding protein [Bacteroidales bacterium]
MKFIVTGSLGHISRPLAEKLIADKHDVTIISSKTEKIKEIEALGAKAAIGSVEDVAFLTATFKGADAVYTMVPPFFGAADWKKYIAGIGENLAAAVKASGVKYVVNLSSIGAHMPDGCGPVSGLYFTEQALNSLEGVNVKHLRPGFFYYNFFGNIGMIKHMGIIGGNYGTGAKLAIVHPADIAAVAASELSALSFSGKSIRYIVGDEKTTDEIAGTLGAAIGKPDLKWVDFADSDTLGALQQNGLPAEIASNYVEMGSAMRSGKMAAEYNAQKSFTFEKTKLEHFAKEFAAVYSQ